MQTKHIDQAEIATIAWMNTMRRVWLTEFPGKPCPVPPFEELNMQGRRMMLVSMVSALRAAETAIKTQINNGRSA